MADTILEFFVYCGRVSSLRDSLTIGDQIPAVKTSGYFCDTPTEFIQQFCAHFSIQLIEIAVNKFCSEKSLIVKEVNTGISS